MTSLNSFFKYSLFLAVTLLVLAIIKVFDISYPMTFTITNTTKTSEFSVVGEGKVEAVPDTAYVDAGITVNKAASAEKAESMLSDVNNKLIAAMKALGIEKADIKTSNYSITPNYEYISTGNKVDGYNGNATITIKVKNIPLLSKVISEVTNAGANNISGTRFVIDNPEKYREQARDRAIENAKTQAAKLAKNLGISLGKVINVVESSSNNYYPRYDALMSAPKAAGGGESGPVVEPGTQTVTSTVTLYFEKK